MWAMCGGPTIRTDPGSIRPTCATARASDSGGTRRSARSGSTTASSWIKRRVRSSVTSTSPWVPHSRRGGQEAMRGMKLVNAAVVLGAGVVVGMWTGAPASSAQSGAGTRVAIIDVQRVLARSAAGVAAREQLEKEKAAMQKQVDGQRVEVEKMRDELEKKGDRKSTRLNSCHSSIS